MAVPKSFLALGAAALVACGGQGTTEAISLRPSFHTICVVGSGKNRTALQSAVAVRQALREKGFNALRCPYDASGIGDYLKAVCSGALELSSVDGVVIVEIGRIRAYQCRPIQRVYEVGGPAESERQEQLTEHLVLFLGHRGG